MIKQEKTTRKTQVVGFRLLINEWLLFEKICIENKVPMSSILQEAVKQFLTENK
jgi:hypothetical protein